MADIYKRNIYRMNPWKISQLSTIALIIIIGICAFIYSYKDSLPKKPADLFGVVPAIPTLNLAKIKNPLPKVEVKPNYLIWILFILILGGSAAIYYKKNITLWARDHFILNVWIVLALLFAVIWVFQIKKQTTDKIVIDYFKIRKLEVTLAFAVLYIMFAFLSVTIVFTYAALYESQKVCHPLMYYLGNKRGCRSDSKINDNTRGLKEDTKKQYNSAKDAANAGKKAAKDAEKAAKDAEKAAEYAEKNVEGYAIAAETAAEDAEEEYVYTKEIDNKYVESENVNVLDSDMKDARDYAENAKGFASNSNDAVDSAKAAVTDVDNAVAAAKDAASEANNAKDSAENAKSIAANDLSVIASKSVNSSAYRTAEKAYRDAEKYYNECVIHANKANASKERAIEATKNINDWRKQRNNAVNSDIKAKEWAKNANILVVSLEKTQAKKTPVSGFTNINPSTNVQTTASRLYSNSLEGFQSVSDYLKAFSNSYENIQNRYFDTQEKTIEALTKAFVDPISVRVLPFINKPIEKILDPYLKS